jgi:hypothetical protein
MEPRDRLCQEIFESLGLFSSGHGRQNPFHAPILFRRYALTPPGIPDLHHLLLRLIICYNDPIVIPTRADWYSLVGLRLWAAIHR